MRYSGCIWISDRTIMGWARDVVNWEIYTFQISPDPSKLFWRVALEAMVHLHSKLSMSMLNYPRIFTVWMYGIYCNTVGMKTMRAFRLGWFVTCSGHSSFDSTTIWIPRHRTNESLQLFHYSIEMAGFLGSPAGTQLWKHNWTILN